MLLFLQGKFQVIAADLVHGAGEHFPRSGIHGLHGRRDMGQGSRSFRLHEVRPVFHERASVPDGRQAVQQGTTPPVSQQMVSVSQFHHFVFRQAISPSSGFLQHADSPPGLFILTGEQGPRSVDEGIGIQERIPGNRFQDGLEARLRPVPTPGVAVCISQPEEGFQGIIRLPVFREKAVCLLQMQGIPGKIQRPAVNVG